MVVIFLWCVLKLVVWRLDAQVNTLSISIRSPTVLARISHGLSIYIWLDIYLKHLVSLNVGVIQVFAACMNEEENETVTEN